MHATACLLDESKPAPAGGTFQCREGRSHMSREATVAVMCAAALGLSLACSPVQAQIPPDSVATLTCQLTTNKWLSKVVREVGKCSQRCIRSARRMGGPYYGCSNDGGEMKQCVDGTPTAPGILPKAAA